MHIPFGRIVIYGFLIYAVVFMLWTLLYSYGVASILVFGDTARILNYVAVIVAAFVALRHIGTHTLHDALLYGIGWACMHIVLDVVYVTPAAGFEALLAPSVWINYALVFFTPLGAALHARAHNATNITEKTQRV